MLQGSVFAEKTIHSWKKSANWREVVGDTPKENQIQNGWQNGAPGCEEMQNDAVVTLEFLLRSLQLLSSVEKIAEQKRPATGNET